MSIADRVAVLYLGQLAAVGPTARFDTQVIVDLMTTGTSARLAAEPTAAAETAPPAEQAQPDGPGGPAVPGDVSPGSPSEH